MPDVFASLDALIAADRSFAVYRLPGLQPVLQIQESGDPQSFDSVVELNGRSGFVLAPFQTTGKHPVVLIRPDKTLTGIDSMLQYTESLSTEGRKSNRIAAEREGMDDEKSDAYTLYQSAFDLFLKALHAGSCEKIVLSRTLKLPRTGTFSAGNVFGAALEAYPDAFVHLCHTPVTGTWLGSSPEILLSGEGDRWQTVALAGTKRIKEESEVWDAKNIREQQVVTAYLEKQLRIKNLMGSMSEPYTVRAGQLMHIKTDFRFRLPEQGNVGELLDFLHPTPAVCGYPKTEACRLILAHEGYDRAYYSGFVGPLNLEGKTDLYVNLRCASLTERSLVLYAGGGLMPDSELSSEWEETEGKLQTLLSLIQN